MTGYRYAWFAPMLSHSVWVACRFTSRSRPRHVSLFGVTDYTGHTSLFAINYWIIASLVSISTVG